MSMQEINKCQAKAYNFKKYSLIELIWKKNSAFQKNPDRNIQQLAKTRSMCLIINNMQWIQLAFKVVTVYMSQTGVCVVVVFFNSFNVLQVMLEIENEPWEKLCFFLKTDTEKMNLKGDRQIKKQAMEWNLTRNVK